MKKVLALCSLILLIACESDYVSNAYSKLPASFTFRLCSAIPPMKAALSGSAGSFFSVRATADNQYIFTSNDDLENPYSYHKDALDMKVAYVCRAGFIIGTPIYDSRLQAYDLACPNCYLNSINRPLTFQSRTRLVCTRCQCAYSLDNEQAILVEGQSKATHLHRYHVQYDGMNNLFVSN